MPVGGRPRPLFLLSAIDGISVICYQKSGSKQALIRQVTVEFSTGDNPMNALVPISPGASRPALPVELTATLELAADFAKASKAPATQAAYASDFAIFEAWCTARGLCALPASSVAQFSTKRAGLRILPVKLPVKRFAAGIITVKGRTLSPLADLFIESARAAARSIGDPTEGHKARSV